MQLIFSIPGKPRRRGKIERFFRTVNESFFITEPGFENSRVEKPLSLQQFTERFHRWLLEQYFAQPHSELGCSPHERWENGGFLPRQIESLEQLDLLLYNTVPTARRVRQDGIQVKRILEINKLQTITKEVVEVARENLVIGLI